MKRPCQHAEDIADHSTWCQNEAKFVTWCNKSHTVGVYQCEDHYDPTYEGWTLNGNPEWTWRKDGFECRPEDVYPPVSG